MIPGVRWTSLPTGTAGWLVQALAAPQAANAADISRNSRIDNMQPWLGSQTFSRRQARMSRGHNEVVFAAWNSGMAA